MVDLGFIRGGNSFPAALEIVLPASFLSEAIDRALRWSDLISNQISGMWRVLIIFRQVNAPEFVCVRLRFIIKL